MEKKSQWIALLATLVFGPVGLMYATVPGGIILTALILVVAILAWPLVLAAALFAWPASIISGAIVVALHNRDIDQRDARAAATRQAAETKEWQTLIKYDEHARHAVSTIERFGDTGLMELRRAYVVLKDPAKLPAAAERIAADLASLERCLH